MISFLAINNEAADITASGARFQSLAESLLKLNFAATDLESSFHCLIELVLLYVTHYFIISSNGVVYLEWLSGARYCIS